MTVTETLFNNFCCQHH